MYLLITNLPGLRPRFLPFAPFLFKYKKPHIGHGAFFANGFDCEAYRHSTVFAYLLQSGSDCEVYEHSVVFVYLLFNGVDGSRTRVQKPVHRPSTIIVHLLSFPTPDSDRRLSGFSSFMIRTYAQSFAYAVSCLIDAGLPEGRYPGPTAAKP